MNIILYHNHYDADHLAAVQSEMEALGAPTVQAIWLEAYGAWMALEGCHRLRAAQALGLTPEIIAVEWDGDRPVADYVADVRDEISIEQVTDDAHRREMLTF